MNKIKTVLIVDDDKQLLTVLSSKFEQSGYKVLTAHDGLEGLEQAFKEHPDLILLDLRMPNLDGEAMLNKIRSNPWGKTVPVIVLTNSDEGHTVYLNIKDTVQGYFVKADVSLKDILSAVDSHLHAGSKLNLSLENTGEKTND